MNKNWVVSIRVGNLNEQDASALWELFDAQAKVFPGVRIGGDVTEEVDWPTERAAILEAVKAVDDAPPA